MSAEESQFDHAWHQLHEPGLWEEVIFVYRHLKRKGRCAGSSWFWVHCVQKSATVPTGTSRRVVSCSGLSLQELPPEMLPMSENLTEVRERLLSLCGGRPPLNSDLPQRIV